MPIHVLHDAFQRGSISVSAEGLLPLRQPLISPVNRFLDAFSTVEPNETDLRLCIALASSAGCLGFDDAVCRIVFWSGTL